MTLKRPLILVLALMALAIGLPVWLGQPPAGPAVVGEWPYSQFLQQLNAGHVDQVRLDPNRGVLLVTLQPRPVAVDHAAIEPDPATLAYDRLPVLSNSNSDPDAWTRAPVWQVYLPSGDAIPSLDLLNQFTRAHVNFGVLPTRTPPNYALWLSVGLPVVLVLAMMGFSWWLFRLQGGQQQPRLPGALSGKGQASRFQCVDPATNHTRLADLAGVDEVKEEAAEFIAYLKNPSSYQRVNAKMTRGVLLVGPPGTGKTMLARAIAGEAGVPFFPTSGSDFVEMFVGVGASRVRELFALAKASAPAIIFIDEIDAVGRQRSAPGTGGGSHDEREQTLNQLLVEMEGFARTENIVVIAATNRADMLDKALRRPGRFDREVQVDLPDRAARVLILKAHTHGVPLDVNVNFDAIAAGTPGFSGADLANVVNEAALRTARTQGMVITQAALEWARDKVMMGVEKKGGIKNTRERQVVAYHEAGHAIVARFDPLADPVHKITIMPRGRALGLTAFLPTEEAYNHDVEVLRSQLRGLMGGRAAEDVALETRTVGASNDFQRATQIARHMVATWGMIPELGPVAFEGDQGGTPWGQAPTWSEEWRQQVDAHVVRELREAYRAACDCLEAHRTLLDTVAQALLVDETLDAAAFEALVQADRPTLPLLDPSP